jgi:hypothetical protein
MESLVNVPAKMRSTYLKKQALFGQNVGDPAKRVSRIQMLVIDGVVAKASNGFISSPSFGAHQIGRVPL